MIQRSGDARILEPCGVGSTSYSRYAGYGRYGRYGPLVVVYGNELKIDSGRYNVHEL